MKNFKLSKYLHIVDDSNEFTIMNVKRRNGSLSDMGVNDADEMEFGNRSSGRCHDDYCDEELKSNGEANSEYSGAESDSVEYNVDEEGECFMDANEQIIRIDQMTSAED